MPVTLDLAKPLYDALLTNSYVTGLLPVYLGGPTVFTRRPAPPNAPYPMILVSPDITNTDVDGVDNFRPEVTRDIIVYGRNDTPANYDDVEAMAYSIANQFHRKRDSFTVAGWSVIAVSVNGPIPGPTDDESVIARVVSVRAQLGSIT